MKSGYKQTKPTIQKLIDEAQQGGESSTPDIAIDTSGTVTYHNGATAITGEITISHDGIATLSTVIDYMGVYSLVKDIYADFDIELVRNSNTYYLQNSAMNFQDTTLTAQITNNTFNLCVPVKAEDKIKLRISSKELNQAACATIINNLTTKYLIQKWV